MFIHVHPVKTHLLLRIQAVWSSSWLLPLDLAKNYGVFKQTLIAFNSLSEDRIWSASSLETLSEGTVCHVEPTDDVSLYSDQTSRLGSLLRSLTVHLVCLLSALYFHCDLSLSVKEFTCFNPHFPEGANMETGSSVHSIIIHFQRDLLSERIEFASQERILSFQMSPLWKGRIVLLIQDYLPYPLLTC